MKKKTCTKCKDDKFVDEFNKNKTRKDGYNNICRVCSNKVSKKYYHNNTEKHKKVVLITANKVRNENRKRYFELLKTLKCVDCGENNPFVLEFDHKDGTDKKKGVGELVANGTSWKIIQKEIDKCEIRCANHHRIRTAKQFGWYKDLI